MGCCGSCCEQKKSEYHEITGGGGKRGKGEEEKEEAVERNYEWEVELLDNKVVNCVYVSHAAIVSFPSGTLRAAIPRTFVPVHTGIKDIVSALKGDTSGLEKRNVSLGSQTPVCTPGKVDSGKAIYCTDGREGGCVAIKTKECVLIVFYNGNADTALTLGTELAEFMEENGR